MANFLEASVAEKGERVTTRGNFGVTGLGRLVDGLVYQSGGNGYYYRTETRIYVRRERLLSPRGKP